MNVLMIGVDKTSKGGMLTVIENYLNSDSFCKAVNLQYIPTVIRANKWIKIKTFIEKLPQIKKTIKKKQIDIVHVHMAEKGSVFREGYVIHIAKKMGCKTIIHMHGATIEGWYNRQNAVIKKIIKKIFCSPDVMIVLGSNWVPFMQSVMLDDSKIHVLHNAVNVPNSNHYNVNAANFLFYGMLIQRKGIDDLLMAFKNILPYIPTNINLALYGDDYDSVEKIQDKIDKFKLNNRAVYKGWLTQKNKAEVYESALANILPSYNEGLPMTILETMGYGIPNISTNIAAIPEAVISDENGILIEPGDVKALEEAMIKLANDKTLRSRYSENAYIKAKNEFSIESHFSELMDIYLGLVDRKKRYENIN